MGNKPKAWHLAAREAVIDRRQAMRTFAIAAGAVTAAACGSDGTTAPSRSGGTIPPATTAPTTAAPPTTALPTTTVAPEPTIAFDPNTPWWLQGGFAPVAEEVELTDLEVVGALPPSLTGLYARNGSNPLEGSGHWFFGDGMAHGLRLERGQAKWYRNRFVQTPQFTGAIPDGPPGREAGYSNVSFFTHAGRLLSSGEVGWPMELSPDDLSTVGVESWGGALGPNFTAHPKVDPATGLMHAFGYGFVDPFLTYYVISADGSEVVHSTVVPVSGPTMMHDFAITDSDVVFWELPVVFSLDAAVAGDALPYAWDPSYGSRLGVLPLGGDGADTRWVEIENGYVFHGTNAWRDGEVIHLDVNRIDSAFDGRSTNIGSGDSTLHRWSLDTSGAELAWTDQILLPDIAMDFPMIDRRFTGRAHTQAWYALAEDLPTGDGLMFPGVIAYDVASGDVTRWDSGPGLQPGEPLFVPDSDGAGEGEGWLLSFGYSPSSDSSRLLVLDATDVAAGPVAEVTLPVRVPFGFHGTWVSG
ncbi:MAG: 9-cis-epoxycarotenoid dioxygenase [Acidimicrobiales bacterium]|nr:9-cis-epoxycarotenoid dioxygenase [Acidimicrobiales bacterium]